MAKVLMDIKSKDFSIMLHKIATGKHHPLVGRDFTSHINQTQTQNKLLGLSWVVHKKIPLAWAYQGCKRREIDEETFPLISARR